MVCIRPTIRAWRRHLNGCRSLTVGVLCAVVPIGIGGQARAQCSPSVLDVRVVNTISGPYTVNTVSRAPLVLVEGQSYTFNFPASAGGQWAVPTLHPFILTTDPDGGGANPGTHQINALDPNELPGYTVGAHCASGCAAGNTFTCTPGALTPSIFYYQCNTHLNLGAMITVLRMPLITEQPLNVTTCAGASASFTVGATLAEGTLTYQWRHDGLAIPGPEAQNATYLIASVGPADAGLYDCVVSNQCASVTSLGATLGSCPADIANNAGLPGCDGGVDINDLLFFLGAFESGSPLADLDNGSGTGTPDGGVDVNDLLYFLGHFESGC